MSKTGVQGRKIEQQMLCLNYNNFGRKKGIAVNYTSNKSLWFAE